MNLGGKQICKKILINKFNLFQNGSILFQISIIVKQLIKPK